MVRGDRLTDECWKQHVNTVYNRIRIQYETSFLKRGYLLEHILRKTTRVSYFNCLALCYFRSDFSASAVLQ